MNRKAQGIPEEVVRWVVILAVLIVVLVFIGAVANVLDFSFFDGLGGI